MSPTDQISVSGERSRHIAHLQASSSFVGVLGVKGGESTKLP